MSSKKWLIMFAGTILLLALMVAAFNFVTDPFGVFGDVFFDWFSYDATNNPRAAKITYLEKHNSEYDSYIIGSSSTSSFPVENFNKYYSANFFNMIMYGADMKDVEETCRYLIDNYTVKNIIVNVYIENGLNYDTEENELTHSLHEKVSGVSKIDFYGRFLFANIKYGVAKIKSYMNDTYLTQEFDVFNMTTGAYDKKVRDAEPISSMEKYLESYPVFESYPKYGGLDLKETDRCMESVARIRDMCEENGVTLTVVTAPVYIDYITQFDREQVENFYTKLADVCDYWDFSVSSVSYEPRYFYDATHFRNCVGTMTTARIFGDESVYIPDDFGILVTADNAEEHVKTYWSASKESETDNTAIVPILMYHHISEDVSNDMIVSPQSFEEQIKELKDAGYTAIFLDELIDYVESGAELPERPICITFDDGYLSNYEYAYPMLEKYGMKATIFVIGSSVGADTYKDTGNSIYPHFGYAEAEEMLSSGVIDIQSHTYDMHQSQQYESGVARTSILKFDDESEKEYIKALKKDCHKQLEEFDENLGTSIYALAFPYGLYDVLAQETLQEMGIKVTLTTDAGNNVLVKGLPQSLLSLNRYTVTDGMSGEDILKIAENARG